MDQTFHVPMQYCSLQHWTLLSPRDTSTTEHHFCFDPATSFFLELLVIALLSSPSAHWTPSELGCSCSCVISFCFFILFMLMLFSQQEYWNGLPFPPPMDHVLPELFTMTCPSWVALHSMAYSFIELHKRLHHDKAVMQEWALHTKPSKMTPSLFLVSELLSLINSVLETMVLRGFTCV